MGQLRASACGESGSWLVFSVGPWCSRYQVENPAFVCNDLTKNEVREENGGVSERGL